MQLPRVVIAAVFFVIGALIAIPALVKTLSSESRASTPASSSASPSASSPSPTKSGASPSPTRSKATRSPTPSPSRTSPTPKPPLQPLSATIGSVTCPSREVNITIANTGTQREDYGIEKDDDTASVPGQIGPHTSKAVTVRLREDRSTRVQVNWANKEIETRTLKANCKKAGAAPPSTPPSKLPHTGPDNGVLWARATTGVAAMVTGAIILWYGGIWPRRRERIFAKKTSG